MQQVSFQSRKGFTLIELLLVIGIIAILASIVIVAINPTRQLGQARDTQRRSDVNTILSAVYQYSIDNNGSLPGGLTAPTAATEICDTSDEPTGCIDLDALTTNSLYLTAIPSDPQAGTGTDYLIAVASGGRITVSATGEVTTNISVTR